MRPRIAAATLLALAALAAFAPPARALRVTTWNLLNYPNIAFPQRQAYFRTAMQALDTDVMIVQELHSAAGADSFLAVLRTSLPGRRWGGGAGTYLSTCESAIYYDSLAVSISNLTAVATGGPRQVLLARVTPLGYRAAAATFRLYSIHFKAGNPATTPSDSTTRRVECTSLRNTLNAAPAGTNILVGGDTNFYGSWEGGYVRLTESQLDNDGRLFDLLSMPGTWNNPAYAPYHTQCPCLNSCLTTDFAGGGLDDRFDLFLSSAALNDGQGLDLVHDVLPGGYGAFGNDGEHYNDDLNGGGFNDAVGLAVANALLDASDHLPVIATLALPAKLSAPSALAFGDVIAGAAAAQNLAVDDLPAPPAQDLTYSLAAPAGFTAPAGPFTNRAADPPDLRAIGMDTGTVGVKSGTLLVASNDLDTTSKAVQLSGRVLAHAAPSLDSLRLRTAADLDLGAHAAGGFRDSSVSVFDLGWNALQARLLVTSATVVGGAGRFSLVAGTCCQPIAGAGSPWTLRFDDAGATPDSTYQATLLLATRDEALPGAAPRDTLRVSLLARPASGVTGVPAGAAALALEPARPNPLRRGTRFGFSLPAPAPVSLVIYDLNGRRVAVIAAGEMGAGHHDLGWNAQDGAGRPVRAGLYFARFSTPGLTRIERLVVLP
ncbi:MAG TPA: FlgD immunoglobulin-like domain containing protein [Candidatus Eisenbacteria bacterium]|nr:FlgD immunoglobulin-like domain containing protein [Candidatus Eisenbacteria bacterium]